MSERGLYLHVPFCDGKCPYCDFYSLRGSEEQMDAYVEAMERAMRSGATACDSITSVYFGGGTPNLLGADRLARLLRAVREYFPLSPDAEITLEANPTHVEEAFFAQVRRAGFHRLSLGMQSANADELALLGRRHSTKDVSRAVDAARKAGFDNLSLDLMLGLPGSGRHSLLRSIDFACGLGPEHLSAYILKVEEGTPFAARGVLLPGDDEAAEQYLFLVQELARRGYAQYEISNFARPGRESRHNLLYWRCREYLGFGPGAHSFWQGKRFFYPRDLEGFLRGDPPVEDGIGGDFAEYAMLALRLTEGLQRAGCADRFGPAGEAAFARVRQRAASCPPELLRVDEDRVSFTPQGFLVSNALLLRLLGDDV